MRYLVLHFMMLHILSFDSGWLIIINKVRLVLIMEHIPLFFTFSIFRYKCLSHSAFLDWNLELRIQI